MTKPHKIVLDFTCFALLEVCGTSGVVATVFYRLAAGKVYRRYETAKFKSTGPAIEWAQSIEPTIQIVKVAHDECE
jgi:hypothetical protein